MRDERLPVYCPEDDLVAFTPQQEVDFVHCLTSGMTIPEISDALGVNSTSLRDQIVEKMTGDQGLEETLGSVKRLPFVSEDVLGETEAMVYSLRNLGFKRVEVAKILGLDQSNAGKHYKRAVEKTSAGKDIQLPVIDFKEVADGHTFGLIGAIHREAKKKLSSSDTSDNVRVNLSVNESITLLWRCTGRTYKQIAAEMGISWRTVKVYLDRASKKLGVHGEYPLIDRTLMEIMWDQKKNNPEQSDCISAQEGV